MKRIKEKESMDSIVEVEALDRLEKSFIAKWITDNFVDTALNIGSEKGRVLDIGTGSGLIPIKIFKKNPNLEIYGIDISPEMIKKANENLSNYNLENEIVFLVGDCTDLPFKDNYFDLITCNHLMHHLDSPIPLFNEIASVAKDGAGIMIGDVRRQKTKLQFLFYRYILKALYEKKQGR